MKTHLEELLKMSRAQEQALTDGRVEDALSLMAEREELALAINKAELIVNPADTASLSLIERIMESDERVRLLSVDRMSAVSEKLAKRLRTRNVASAYHEG